MPKFSVTLSERVSYEIHVEAADEDAASRAAEDLFVQSGAPFRDFPNSSVEREAADWVERLPDDATVSTANPNGDVPHALQQAVLAAIAAFPEIGTDAELNGGDAVERLGSVIPALRAALAACGVEIPAGSVPMWSDHDRNVPLDEQDAFAPGSLADMLEARGYLLTETGGGCTAWVRTMPNGEHIVVTSTDGGSEPTEDDWLIGRYPDEAWDADAGFYRSTADDPDGSFEAELSDIEATPIVAVRETVG